MKIIKFDEKLNSNVIEIHESQDFFLLGRQSGELNVTFDLKVENITVNIYGLILGDGDKNFNLRTKIIHSVPNAISWVLIKGIFADQSKFDFEGMISIKPGAVQSDAYLQNDNLLLNDDAVVNSSPQLEIANDDVKASHGVTISTLDELQEFYLKSRGLGTKITENLLIKGFASQVVEKLDDKRIIELVNSFFHKI